MKAIFRLYSCLIGLSAASGGRDLALQIMRGALGSYSLLHLRILSLYP
jgi:hypothetical protein